MSTDIQERTDDLIEHFPMLHDFLQIYFKLRVNSWKLFLVVNLVISRSCFAKGRKEMYGYSYCFSRKNFFSLKLWEVLLAVADVVCLTSLMHRIVSDHNRGEKITYHVCFNVLSILRYVTCHSKIGHLGNQSISHQNISAS